MRLFFTFALAAFQTIAVAQVSRPGYVVVEGDTLRGQIWVGTEGAAGMGARFQASADSDSRAVGVGDALAFGEDGGRAYRRGRFALQPGTQTALGFARVVRDGAADLLRFETDGGLSVFVLELGGERTPLYVLERGLEGVPHVPGVAEYRQALFGRLASCEGAADRARSARYQERDLAAVVDAYNACEDPLYAASETASARRRRTRVRLNLAGGYATSAFRRAIPLASVDPGQSSVQLGALAEVSPGALPRSLAITVGAEYDFGMVRRVDHSVLTSASESARDAVTLSLGGRVTVSAAGTPVYLGGGVLNGRTVSGSAGS